MDFTTRQAAAILGVEPKRLDNLCVRAATGAIATGSRGSARKFGAYQLELLAIALLLERDLGVPLREAVALAGRLLRTEGGRIGLGVLGAVHFDLPKLRTVLQGAIADAEQDREPVRRGRPPGKKKRGASL